MYVHRFGPFCLLVLLASSLCSGIAYAQRCTVAPARVKLGETLRITCPAEFASAMLNQRTAKLYLQPDGRRFGLLPISVKDSPGSFTMVVSRAAIQGGRTGIPDDFSHWRFP